jgi:hypothetical protein
MWLLIIALVIIGILAGGMASWSLGLHGQADAIWVDEDRTMAMMDAHYNISGQPSTLYLDPGYVLFYFTSQPACRYAEPLPIQRNKPIHLPSGDVEWDMTNAPGYWEDWNCTMNYTGKYIIALDTWMNWTAPAHRPIWDMINTSYERMEYVKVRDDWYSIYMRKG